MLGFRLGWRNLWRNKRRTAIELSAIGGSVFLAMSIQNLNEGVYRQMVDDGVRMGSGHIGFYHPQWHDEGRTGMSFDAAPVLDALAPDPDVVAVYPRSYLAGLARAARGARPAAALGLDFEREAGTNPLLDAARLVTGALPDPARTGRRVVEALIGETMARELGLDVGRRFVWTAQDHEGVMQSVPVRVTGILRTGLKEMDASTVIMARQALAPFLGSADRIHELAVMLRTPGLIAPALPRFEAVAARQADLVALPWQKAMPGLESAIAIDRAGNVVFVGFMFFLVGMGTINTLLMAVMERMREFGVFRALGMRRRQLLRMVLAEAAVLGAVGVNLGLLATLLLGLYLSRRGIDLTNVYGEFEFGGVLIDPVMRSAWDWPQMAVSAAVMFGIALLASLVPAWRAARVRPADAIRRH